MNVALCCIGRLENRYAVEYVEYYKNIGFDKIFIYDNNHDGEEHFEDVLQKHIDSGFVDIVNVRNKDAYQLYAYNDCYSKHGDEYDWIAFFDFDEFFTIVNGENVKNFFNRPEFVGKKSILINWLCYDDNDILKDDGRGCLERFTRPVVPLNFKFSYIFPENSHVKTILHGGMDDIKFLNPHCINRTVPCCNATGIPCASTSTFLPYDYQSAYLRHFRMKTIEEWATNKQKRGVADRDMKRFAESYPLSDFFKMNRKTDEKVKYLNSIMKEINDEKDKFNNVDIFICTHKEFEPKVTNSVYKIIYNGNRDLKIDLPMKKYPCYGNDDVLDDEFWSELYMYKNLPHNLELKKYVGFCHYRRYFSFLDNVPNMDDIMKTCDVVLPNPDTFDVTLREQYGAHHNIDDIDIMGNVIRDKFPEYYNMWETAMNGKTLFKCNMFIMKRDDFKEYVEFVSGAISEFINRIGTDIYKRIDENKDKYIKEYYPNNTPEYQYRIGGFLSERLTTTFIFKKFKRAKLYNVIITENKYKK